MKRFALMLSVVFAACAPQSSVDGGVALEDAGFSDAGLVDAGAADAGLDAGNPCTSPEVPAEDGGCVFGPTAEPGACPAYDGLSCVLSFTRLAVGDHSTETLTVFNHGGAPLHISDVVLEAPAAFELLSSVPGPVPPQGWASIAVRLSPQTSGTVRGLLHVMSDAVYPSSLAVPLEGGTPNASCGGADACLINELCMGDVCGSCVDPTPPPCQGGRLVSVATGGGCAMPTCRCDAGQLYQPGLGCVTPLPCGANGQCSDGSICQSWCCSFPSCLCAKPTEGVCAP